MLPEQQQRIMGYFIEEAKDHLNTIEQGLLNLQGTIEDNEMMNEVFRAAHSVKGGAAMLGIGAIQKVAHRLEDYFKVLRDTPVKIDQKLESLFLAVFDALQALLEQLQGPFGLQDEVSNNIMAGVEPVFTNLHTHLENQPQHPIWFNKFEQLKLPLVGDKIPQDIADGPPIVMPESPYSTQIDPSPLDLRMVLSAHRQQLEAAPSAAPPDELTLIRQLVHEVRVH